MRSPTRRVWRCIPTRARPIDIKLVGLLVFSVNRSSLIAGWALPDNRLYVVPAALSLNPRVNRAVLADSVEAGRAPHTTHRGPSKLLRTKPRLVWGVGARVNRRKGARIRAQPALQIGSARVKRQWLFEGDDAINNSVAHSTRVVSELRELFPGRVGVFVAAIALHGAQCDEQKLVAALQFRPLADWDSVVVLASTHALVHKARHHFWSVSDFIPK